MSQSLEPCIYDTATTQLSVNLDKCFFERFCATQRFNIPYNDCENLLEVLRAKHLELGSSKNTKQNFIQLIYVV